MSDREPRIGPIGAVWEVSHAYSATINGYEEVEFPRLLGVYSSEELAEDARARASSMPGFDGQPGVVDEAGELVVDRYEIGEIGWRGGFFSVDAEGHEA